MENKALKRTMDSSTALQKKTLPQQQSYLQSATAPNTRRAYQSAIRQFEKHGGLLPATESDIAHYITVRATELNPRTLSLHLTALSNWHRYQQLNDPTQTPQIRKLLTGIYRQHGKPKRKAKALHPEHIKKMILFCQQNPSLKSIRNNAMIQMAYFGAFRRSELVAITLEQIQFDPKGLLILLPHSKTDQLNEGKVKALPKGQAPFCPITALKHWLATAQINSGFIFRAINRWDQIQSKAMHSDSMNAMIKSIASACRLEGVKQLSTHSLRRGFATSAACVGADFAEIKRQGGWKNDQTVREYIEEGQLFDSNAANQLIQIAFQQNEGKS